MFYVRNTCARIGLLSQQHMISSRCYSLIAQSARSRGGNLPFIVLLEPGPASLGLDHTRYRFLRMTIKDLLHLRACIIALLGNASAGLENLIRLRHP